MLRSFELCGIWAEVVLETRISYISVHSVAGHTEVPISNEI